jgi:hypothetical protein
METNQHVVTSTGTLMGRAARARDASIAEHTEGVQRVVNRSFVPTPTSSIALRYSAFVDQVADGKPSAVRIAGEEISVTFVQAMV